MNLKAILLGFLGLLAGSIGLGAIDSLYVDIASLVAAVVLFSEWLFSVVKVKKFLAQVITWGVGIVFAFTGWIFELGFLAVSPAGDPYLWYEVLVLGIGVSLIANGVWPLIVKQILQKLKLVDE